ncbi:MAG TPA: sigma-70 family RNA polymerase sigma factor [Pyrinomonadaceae bacterium]|nr:sigma-70 family RNA polymerase sigma factor [Pyrinomonadaceae bacterium]
MNQAILQRVASGDRAAVQDCLDKYGGLVWSIARKMLRNSHEAEDAVQEIFIDVWKNAAKFDASQASETTFIAMIARRRIIDRIRFASRRIAAESIEDVTVQPEVRGDRDIQVCIEAKEAAEALKALRPEQRRVLQLSIVQGMSQQEIAEATGMPLGTVKTHARRGLLMLREAIGLGSLEQQGRAQV